MMTIDGTIEYLKNAKGYEVSFSVYDGEEKQLIEWLTDYKRLKELELKNEL